LQSSLACAIPETHLFKYPTVHTLTEYLAGAILPAPTPVIPAAVHAASEARDEVLADLPGLSADDLDASITADLEALEALLRDADA